MKIKIILVVIGLCIMHINSVAQSNWQKVTFEFNNEHIIETKDSITKFQYAYKTIPQVEDKWYYWFDTIIHKTRSGYTAKLLDGYFIQHDKKGNLCIQGQFLDGLKNWTWKFWYPNGQLRSIENWKTGVKSGVFVKYSADGKIISSIEYNKGVLDGETIYYKADTIFETRSFKKGKDVTR